MGRVAKGQPPADAIVKRPLKECGGEPNVSLRLMLWRKEEMLRRKDRSEGGDGCDGSRSIGETRGGADGVGTVVTVRGDADGVGYETASRNT